MSSPSWALGHVFPGCAVRIRACKACWGPLCFFPDFFSEKMCTHAADYMYSTPTCFLPPCVGVAPSLPVRPQHTSSLARAVGWSECILYVCMYVDLQRGVSQCRVRSEVCRVRWRLVRWWRGRFRTRDARRNVSYM